MEVRVPRGIHGRRLFWAFIIGLALLLFGIRYLALPVLRGQHVLTAGDLLDRVLEEMLAAVLVAGLLTALLSYFSPEARNEGAVEVVAAKDRGLRLERARVGATQWWFSGAMGRYTRAETLPGLASACREDGRSRVVVLQLIDPRDAELCRRYANLRSSVRGGEQVPWSVEHVQKEVVATIAAAYAIASQQNLLDLRVALRRTVSQQRYDLSDSEVLITTEDERREALAFPAGSQFYTITGDELRLSLQQAQTLPTVSLAVPSELTAADLDALFAETGLDVIGFGDEAKQDIVDAVRAPRNPYA